MLTLTCSCSCSHAHEIVIEIFKNYLTLTFNFLSKIFSPISFMFIIHFFVCFIDVLIILVVSCLVILFGQLSTFSWIGFCKPILLKISLAFDYLFPYLLINFLNKLTLVCIFLNSSITS